MIQPAHHEVGFSRRHYQRLSYSIRSSTMGMITSTLTVSNSFRASGTLRCPCMSSRIRILKSEAVCTTVSKLLRSALINMEEELWNPPATHAWDFLPFRYGFVFLLIFCFLPPRSCFGASILTYSLAAALLPNSQLISENSN